MTIHDFTVGGGLINVLENPNTKDPEMWAECKAALPARVKKYVDDCKESLKEHLEKRPQTCSL